MKSWIHGSQRWLWVILGTKKEDDQVILKKKAEKLIKFHSAIKIDSYNRGG